LALTFRECRFGDGLRHREREIPLRDESLSGRVPREDRRHEQSRENLRGTGHERPLSRRQSSPFPVSGFARFRRRHAISLSRTVWPAYASLRPFDLVAQGRPERSRGTARQARNRGKREEIDETFQRRAWEKAARGYL